MFTNNQQAFVQSCVRIEGEDGGWGVRGLEKVIHIRKRGYCRRAGNGSREE